MKVTIRTTPDQPSPQPSTQPLDQSPATHPKRQSTTKKRVFIIISLVLFIAIVGALIIILLTSNPNSTSTSNTNTDTEDTPTQPVKEPIYSILTGEEISSNKENSTPTYCIQIPNGTDGARPQAGLNEAGVIFEAIAEAGITRFAAIYQNPKSAVIGPIRSLRMYYLEWDTPFDCTIVHAGGADDALAALRSGGYRDLTENYSYMYRGYYANYKRRWNNLFTNATLLSNFGSDKNYTTSHPTGFTRMTPSESEQNRLDSLVEQKTDTTESTEQDAEQDAPVMIPAVTKVALNFGNWATFNVRYQYDINTNTYRRSYETGAAHESYDCPTTDLGEVTPESSCQLVQLSPSVVIAMVVNEKKASDNYHESITTIGSGNVYIFQNGTVIQGTWQKSSAAEQIKFYDENDQEIRLAPGQTWISAIPTYGSVDFK